MPLDLEVIKERLAMATPGPWVSGRNSSHIYGTYHVENPETGVIVARNTGKYDIDFIAHSRTDVERLVAEVEKTRRHLNNALGVMCHSCYDMYLNIKEEIDGP